MHWHLAGTLSDQPKIKQSLTVSFETQAFGVKIKFESILCNCVTLNLFPCYVTDSNCLAFIILPLSYYKH